MTRHGKGEKRKGRSKGARKKSGSWQGGVPFVKLLSFFSLLSFPFLLVVAERRGISSFFLHPSFLFFSPFSPLFYGTFVTAALRRRD